MTGSPAPPPDSTEATRVARQRAIRAASAVLEAEDVEVRDGDERCPSCDTPAAWQVNRRHRFSPFGSVLLTVSAFWIAVLGWLVGFGYTPALVLMGGALFIGLATRKAEICEACGYVRPQGR